MPTSPLPVDPHMAAVYRAKRMPHPEVHMDYIAKGLGPRSWRFQVRIYIYLTDMFSHNYLYRLSVNRGTLRDES